jgi:DNA-binding NarL/FixJ family response regulator
LEIFAPYVELLERTKGPGCLLRENPIVVPLLRLLHEKKRHRTFIERVLEALGSALDAPRANGREALSSREIEVLRVMADGLSNREIGQRLFVCEATVKTHVQRILRKLDAASRTQAIARARESMLL